MIVTLHDDHLRGDLTLRRDAVLSLAHPQKESQRGEPAAADA
jgi:hypothetical protein